MWQGNTQFFSYEQLWLAQIATAKDLLSRTPAVLAAILGVVAAVTLLPRSLDAAGRRFARGAYLLGTVTLLYLAGGWTDSANLVHRLQTGLPVLLAIGASGGLLEWLTRRWQQEPEGARPRMTIGAAFGAVFLVSTGLFIRAAVRTEVAISERSIDLGRFNFQGRVYLKEVVDNYEEYHRIGDFSRKKVALRRFIESAIREGKQDLDRERGRQ